jgi:hypothetical protein
MVSPFWRDDVHQLVNVHLLRPSGFSIAICQFNSSKVFNKLVHLHGAETAGTVTGHVFCADTNQPARFAHVSLEAIPDASAAPASRDSFKTSFAARSTAATSVETTLDGSFTLTGVKPGAYYVIVEKTGYIKPRDIFTEKQIADPSPQMRGLVTAALPRVTVDANHTEQAEVRLDRGAAISGTVLFDDGSPASDVNVRLLHKDAAGKWVPLEGRSVSIRRDVDTDDRGYFRIPSLLGGEYIVEAHLVFSGTKTISSTPDSKGNTMQFAMMDILSTLPFYGSGAPRQSQATSVKLAPGQELTGQDMMLPISKLHKLTGRVAAGADAHSVNAATVALLTRDDQQQIATTDISRDDGLFHFEFVPDGDYILRVTNARDVTWQTLISISTNPINFPPADKENITASYGNVDQPLLLNGDMLDVTVTVPPNTAPAPTGSASPN